MQKAQQVFDRRRYIDEMARRAHHTQARAHAKHRGGRGAHAGEEVAAEKTRE